MWAARPHLGSIFEKLLHRKTFYCLRLVVCSQDCFILMLCFTWNILKLLLGKLPKSGSARLGHIPSLPWESQLPLKPCISLQPLDFKSNCDSSDYFLDVCFISWCSFDLLRKCGLLAHTSAAFLKNCCTEKLFICLRLVSCNQLHIFLFPLLSLVFVKRWIISFTIPYYTTYNTICQPTIVPNFHRSFCAECTRSPTQSTTMFFFTIHFPFCWRFFIEIHKTITKKSKKKKAFRWKIRYHENWGRWHTCQRKKVQTT